VRRSSIYAALCAALLLIVPIAAGADQAPQAQTQKGDDGDPYARFLAHKALMGPQRVALRDEAALNLPEGYAFLPEKPARDFMKRIGNDTDENFLGIILPRKQDTWFAFLEYIPSGYIKDDDAKSWDTDELLGEVRKNTEAGNAERRKQGIPDLEILGWIEKPHYDSATRRLIWSISARDKGNTNSAEDIINYRTLVLGRQGYVSMIMVTNLNAIEGQKPIANLLLSDLSFVPGKRYADFNASTDRVAEYGLAALVGGLVVKKLGLFALIAAFLAKSVKAIGVLFLAGLAAVRRFFTRGKPAPAAATPLPAPPGPSGPGAQ
jgi:uncharacterized membrane-anchored protein